MSTEFCVDATPFEMERFIDKKLGAGSLVDLGPYPIGLALLAFGEDDPEDIAASACLNSKAGEYFEEEVEKFKILH